MLLLAPNELLSLPHTKQPQKASVRHLCQDLFHNGVCKDTHEQVTTTVNAALAGCVATTN